MLQLNFLFHLFINILINITISMKFPPNFVEINMTIDKIKFRDIFGH